MNEELVGKTVRLPQKAWDVIEKEAMKHGRSFEEEVQWLLTADFISDTLIKKMDEIRRKHLTPEEYVKLKAKENWTKRSA
jgi:hypothetical protein